MKSDLNVLIRMAGQYDKVGNTKIADILDQAIFKMALELGTDVTDEIEAEEPISNEKVNNIKNEVASLMSYQKWIHEEPGSHPLADSIVLSDIKHMLREIAKNLGKYVNAYKVDLIPGQLNMMVEDVARSLLKAETIDPKAYEPYLMKALDELV